VLIDLTYYSYLSACVFSSEYTFYWRNSVYFVGEIMMRNYMILIFLALFVLFFIVGFNSAMENDGMKCKEWERHALLKFKQGLQDEYGMLSTLKDGPNADCCKWKGVRCNNHTGYVQRLDLHGSFTHNLSG
jgi:hypothetical protein